MKIDPNEPIKVLHKELIGIQESVFLGDMSHTDLANWFFEFCGDIGCQVDEKHMSTLEEKKKKSSKKFLVNGDNWCCDIHGWMFCKCDPSVHDCTKR